MKRSRSAESGSAKTATTDEDSGQDHEADGSAYQSGVNPSERERGPHESGARFLYGPPDGSQTRGQTRAPLSTLQTPSREKAVINVRPTLEHQPGQKRERGESKNNNDDIRDSGPASPSGILPCQREYWSGWCQPQVSYT